MIVAKSPRTNTDSSKQIFLVVLSQSEQKRLVLSLLQMSNVSRVRNVPITVLESKYNPSEEPFDSKDFPPGKVFDAKNVPSARVLDSRDVPVGKALDSKNLPPGKVFDARDFPSEKLLAFRDVPSGRGPDSRNVPLEKPFDSRDFSPGNFQTVPVKVLSNSRDVPYGVPLNSREVPHGNIDSRNVPLGVSLNSRDSQQGNQSFKDTPVENPNGLVPPPPKRTSASLENPKLLKKRNVSPPKTNTEIPRSSSLSQKVTRLKPGESWYSTPPPELRVLKLLKPETPVVWKPKESLPLKPNENSFPAKGKILGNTHHPESVARIEELEAPKPAPEEAPEAEKQVNRILFDFNL